MKTHPPKPCLSTVMQDLFTYRGGIFQFNNTGKNFQQFRQPTAVLKIPGAYAGVRLSVFFELLYFRYPCCCSAILQFHDARCAPVPLFAAGVAAGFVIQVIHLGEISHDVSPQTERFLFEYGWRQKRIDGCLHPVVLPP